MPENKSSSSKERIARALAEAGEHIYKALDDAGERGFNLGRGHADEERAAGYRKGFRTAFKAAERFLYAQGYGDLSRALTREADSLEPSIWGPEPKEPEPESPAPCPWCGSKATVFVTWEGHKHWWVACGRASCYAMGPSLSPRSYAIAAWNRVAGKA